MEIRVYTMVARVGLESQIFRKQVHLVDSGQLNYYYIPDSHAWRRVFVAFIHLM